MFPESMSRLVGVQGRTICSLDLSSQLWAEAAQVKCSMLQNDVVTNPGKKGCEIISVKLEMVP